MPLIYVQRYVASSGPAAGTGIQYVTGTLTIANPTYVDFDPTLWAGVTVGTPYTIFTYGTLSGSSSSLVAGTLPSGVTGASFADTGPTNGSITVTFS